LRTDPVAHVNNDCVGCGLCGEVSHAAQLCPSFAEINVIENPSLWDRARHRVSLALISLFGGGAERAPASSPAMVPAE
jgi:indolepyruvate ferredoxin oxidoreductase alpha subunit